MSGALGMIITGVLTVDEAYQSVDWMTVFLLAGLIPLGIAFEKTGTASFIAHNILAIIGKPSPIVLLAVVGLLTSFFYLGYIKCRCNSFVGSPLYEYGSYGRW